MMQRLLIGYLLMLLTLYGVNAQDRVVSGKVSDAKTGEGLPGVNVYIKGTTQGTITDVEGEYSIQASNGDILVFQAVGLTTQEIEVGNTSKLDVSMSESTQQLNEIVVNALGFETDRDRSAASSSNVAGQSLVKSGEPGLINSLAGKASGVYIVQNSGDPGAGSRVVLRGATSITGDIQPLVVIDGVPMFNDSYYGEGFGGNLSSSSGSIGSGGGVTQQSRLNDLNPNDIASVEILKGAAAAALWGSRAANGVIVITTKKGQASAGKKFTVNLTSSIALDELNREVPLNNAYGQGAGMLYDPTGVLSWGDRIADRPGGSDDFITDPNDPDYAGFFVADASNGQTYYALRPGTAADPGGGKNSRTTYNPHDVLFKTGYTFTNTIDVGSSGENGNIFASFSDLNQEGIIKDNSNYRRTTARVNFTRFLGKMFTVNASAAYTLTNSDRIQMGSNLNGLFLGGLRTPADFNMEGYQGTYTDPDGNEFPNRQRAYRNYLGANTASGYDNPRWMMNNTLSNARVNRFIGKLELGADPFDWLNLTARLGIDGYTDEREDIFDPLSSGENNGGRFVKETITRRQINFDFIARGNWRINDFIGLNVLAGLGLNDRKLDDHGADIRQFVNPLSPPQLSNTTSGNRITFNREERVKIVGYYGSLGFDLYDQVFVNLTGRVDGWSTFASTSDRFFFYGSADVAWQFTQLIPENSILSFGKLRAAWGQVGRGPDPYLTQTTFFPPEAANVGFGEGWGPGLNGSAYGGAFARNSIAGNPDIKPEIKTEFEIGTDLRFWKDRVSLSATYYWNETKDLIIQVDAAPATGFTSRIANAATIENQGVELELGAEVLKIGDFSWNINANWSRNRNEVTDMSGVQSISLGGFAGTSSRAVLGEQLGVLWGARWARDDAGNIVLDEDGFPSGQAPEAGVLGDPNPDFRAGYGSTFRYKNLSLNVLFDMSAGGKIWNGTKGALAFFGKAGFQERTTTLTAAQASALEVYGGATVANAYGDVGLNQDGSYTLRGFIEDFGGGPVFVDEGYYTSGPGSGFTGPDEQFIEDASWTRLRELTLSYTLNSEGFQRATRLQGMTLSFTGRNLVLWTDYDGIDPDTNLTGSGINALGLDYFQNPATRSYIFTLRLTY